MGDQTMFQRVTGELTGGCGCGCHTGIGYQSACGHCEPRTAGTGGWHGQLTAYHVVTTDGVAGSWWWKAGEPVPGGAPGRR